MSKNPVLNTYNFVTSWNRQQPLDSSQYQLIIRQQPKQARLCSSKERDRRPVDPPPIIQLKVTGTSEEAQNFLQSPYYFMCANLVHPTNNDDAHFTISSRLLAGTVVSSLHKLKDIDNTDGGFFVFGDISVRVEGRYRLRFSLFEIIRDEVVHIQSAVSDVFNVYSPKTFPGMSESTFLSRSFSDQGVRIRIRKEHRIQMKRPQAKIAEVNEGDDADGAQQKKKRRQTFPPIDTSSATQSDFTGPHHMMTASPVGGTFSIPAMRHPDTNDQSSPSRAYLRSQSHSLEYPSRPPYELESQQQLPSVYSRRSSSLGTSSLPLRPVVESDEPPRPQFSSEIYNEPLPYDSPYTPQQPEPPLSSIPGKSSTLPLQPSQPPLPTRSATLPLPPQHTRSATLPPPSLLSGGDYHQPSLARFSEQTASLASSRRSAQFSQLPPSAVATSPQTATLQPAPQYAHPDSYYAPAPHRPIPMKSRTLPAYSRPSRLSPPPNNGTQLPTPRTSIDEFNSHLHPAPFPPTPPLLSSTESSTATGNAMDPRYTPHLTSSPRPAHHNLPASPHILGGKAVSRTSSLPVTPRASVNTHANGVSSISLPPISTLMSPLLKKESPGASVPIANSVVGNRCYQPESPQHHNRQTQYPNGCGNGAGMLSHSRHHYANPMGQSTMAQYDSAFAGSDS